MKPPGFCVVVIAALIVVSVVSGEVYWNQVQASLSQVELNILEKVVQGSELAKAEDPKVGAEIEAVLRYAWDESDELYMDEIWAYIQKQTLIEGEAKWNFDQIRDTFLQLLDHSRTEMSELSQETQSKILNIFSSEFTGESDIYKLLREPQAVQVRF